LTLNFASGICSSLSRKALSEHDRAQGRFSVRAELLRRLLQPSGVKKNEKHKMYWKIVCKFWRPFSSDGDDDDEKTLQMGIGSVDTPEVADGEYSDDQEGEVL
jgi:hypothetical protein